MSKEFALYKGIGNCSTVYFDKGPLSSRTFSMNFPSYQFLSRTISSRYQYSGIRSCALADQFLYFLNCRTGTDNFIVRKSCVFQVYISCLAFPVLRRSVLESGHDRGLTVFHRKSKAPSFTAFTARSILACPEIIITSTRG